MQEIEPREVQDKIEAGDQVLLLDVREDHEVAFCTIENSVHIKMRDIQGRFEELKREDEIVVYCRSGQRSVRVCQFLESQGFANVSNMRGGIQQWSMQVDSSIPYY